MFSACECFIIIKQQTIISIVYHLYDSFSGCGYVKGNQDGHVLKLRFYPSDFFRAYITDSHRRWLYDSVRHEQVMILSLKYNPDPIDTIKYQESGNFLTIHNISSVDNGHYFWIAGEVDQRTRVDVGRSRGRCRKLLARAP